MITPDQLLLHAIGDYVTQSDWMATEKTKRSFAAAVHAIVYSLPFLFFFEPSYAAMAFISGTHFVIDRWRLARYVVWAKNWLAPWSWCTQCQGFDRPGIYTDQCHADRRPHRLRPNPDWELCKATGYPPNRDLWLTFWLMIVVDNILHVLCNGIALKYL